MDYFSFTFFIHFAVWKIPFLIFYGLGMIYDRICIAKMLLHFLQTNVWRGLRVMSYQTDSLVHLHTRTDVRFKSDVCSFVSRPEASACWLMAAVLSVLSEGRPSVWYFENPWIRQTETSQIQGFSREWAFSIVWADM